MTHEQAFLASIHEEPEDDAPCLIYADWLEERDDPRGEFIRVQCHLASMAADDPRWPPLKARERLLLEANWDTWVRPLRQFLGAEASRLGEGWLHHHFEPEHLRRFRRGFIESISMTAQDFLKRAEELFRLMPILHLRLWKAGEVATELANSPPLSKLRGLDFVDYYSAPIDAAAMRVLACSPYLNRLTHLNLSRNYLGDVGVEFLSEAPWLMGLRWLDLGDNGLSAESIAYLVRASHALRLVALLLGGNYLGDGGVQQLVASPMLDSLHLLDLSNSGMGLRSLEQLAASPHLAGLETLDLSLNTFGAWAGHLLARSSLTGLTSLYLSHCDLGDEGVAALLKGKFLASLRSLALNGNNLSDRGAELLATAPGLRGLIVLRLDRNRITEYGEDRLRASPFFRLQWLSCESFPEITL